jgi:radical SAM superfamily enzyme YgiQ (UPF0313 family)
MHEIKSAGYRVVLTADRTLMSEYNGLIFLGFSACVPKGLIPDRLYFSLFCPSTQVNKDGSTKYAPCGTRKIEAALLEGGFKREDVVVAHPDHLDKVIGPRTRVLAITETDPLGMGPATSTFTQIFRGEAYMVTKFKEVLNHPAVKRYRPKIIVGGPGAWQLEDDETRNRLGIDCVVMGEGEKVVDAVIRKAIDGTHLPAVVLGEVVEENSIPIIREPTVDGVVEIARGCGRGCEFCVPTLQRYRCLSIEHILKEVSVNLRAGRQPLLHAEDVLRYKAKGLTVNKEAVIELFRKVKNYPGVESVGMSHFALSSVASAPDVVEEISTILDAGKDGLWLSGQTGLETGSPKLIRKHMSGKCKPFEPDDWPQVVVDAFQTLSDNFWVPVATLIIGLPDETEQDIELTIALVKKLKKFKSLLVPLFFVSEGILKNCSKSFNVENMTRKQSELLLECWTHNLDWAEPLLDEYFTMTNAKLGLASKHVMAYGVNKGRMLIRMCREEYDYDIPAMIRDARNNQIKVIPAPIRLISRMIQLSA